MNVAINNKKIALAYWGGDETDEKKLRQETGISPRCIFKKNEDISIKCFYTNKVAKYLVYFARAY
jgi:hypothetical protein